MPFSIEGVAFLKQVAFLKWIMVGIFLYLIIFEIIHSSHEDHYYEDQVAVLAYHHISNTVLGDVTITPELFRNQLLDLRDRGYSFISLTQFKSFLGGGKVPPNAVLVTFDDGYRSFFTDAYPILRKLRIPAVNFVITKDLENPLASRLAALSREEIKQMTEETPGIDFQCHSDSLHSRSSEDGPLLTSKLIKNGIEETDEQFQNRILQDTRMCINKLSELYKGPVDTYAYPFGAFNEDSMKSLKQAGIFYAFTTRSEMVTRDTNPTQIPRINAGSPFIKFNSLNNLIMRRTVTPLSPAQKIPIQQAIRQLGGTISANDGQVLFEMEGATWNIAMNGSEARSGTYSTISLHEPLTSNNKQIYIQLQDLETILGFQIVYNVNTDQYFERFTPKV